eukprot:gene44418-biopygen109056
MIKIKLMSRVPLFNEAPPECLQTLLERLNEVMVPANEAIVSAGDVPTDIYFIVQGIVEEVDEQGNKMALLKEGDCFGETAILSGAFICSKYASVAETFGKAFTADNILGDTADFAFPPTPPRIFSDGAQYPATPCPQRSPHQPRSPLTEVAMQAVCSAQISPLNSMHLIAGAGGDRRIPPGNGW